MTLKAKILEHKKNNPEATVAEIAKLLNTSKTYVHQTITNYKAPMRSKPVNAEKKEVATTVTQLTSQIAFMEKQILTLRSDVYEQEAVAKALRLQNRGLLNVITYLESKLGIDEIDARLEATRD
jgi:predicted transcriptional regulator